MLQNVPYNILNTHLFHQQLIFGARPEIWAKSSATFLKYMVKFGHSNV